MKANRWLAWCGAVILGATGGAASGAELESGQWGWGPYGGRYMPDSDAIDAGPTGGIRIGRMMTDHVSLAGSFGYVSLDGEEGRGEGKLKADLDLGVMDFNAFYVFRPEAKFSFTLGAGVGWAFVDGKIENSIGQTISDS
jgi:hypothetical protein